MKKFLILFSALLIIVSFCGNVSAFSIDFEDGSDGTAVNNIPGISLLNFNGYNPLYADSRTGSYNVTSDDLGYSMGSGAYHHNGNFFIWAGPQADARGLKIDFTNDDGTWFTTGYSSNDTFYVEALLTDGSVVLVSGAANIRTPMNYLTVNATAGLFIDSIVLHDIGNYWLVDDMSGDTSGVNPPVPEPATMVLFGLGILGLAGVNRKRFKK